MIDINLKQGEPTTNQDIDLIIQQIDMLFDTTPGEVYGAISYGTNYDEFLYNLQLSNESISHQVKCDINQLELFGYDCVVDVTILDGTLNDIILIKIDLFRGDQHYEKIYKLQ